MARTQSSGRIQCQGCKEFPAFRAESFDDEGNLIRGERCNNCNTLRIVRRRQSPKRAAERAKLASLLSYLDASRT